MDKNLDDLILKYEKEYPGVAPLLIACKKGRFDHVKLFITYDKSISVNKVYKHHDCELTLLMIATMNEHFQVVKYLIEQGKADPNIASSGGYNALHSAAHIKKKKLIKLLLTNMSFNSINKKTRDGATPLDYAYNHNDTPIRQEVIDLIREYGGRRGEELRREEIKRNVEEAKTKQYLDLISKYEYEFPGVAPLDPTMPYWHCRPSLVNSTSVQLTVQSPWRPRSFIHFIKKVVLLLISFITL
jgi:hypothetical protein